MYVNWESGKFVSPLNIKKVSYTIDILNELQEADSGNLKGAK
jgi:hypothetical protein